MRGSAPKGGTRHRLAVVAVMLAVASAACGVILGADDDAPTPAADGGGGDGAADGTSSGDGAVTSDASTDRRDLVTPDGADPDVDVPPDITPDASVDAPVLPTCAPPADGGALDPSCDRVVFVTGLAGGYPMEDVPKADAFCQNLASTSSLSRIKGHNFQAWTSSVTGGNASNKLVHATGNYIRPDGTIIAAGWADLTDGTLRASIFHDQSGKSVGAGVRVWTGTGVDGTVALPNCNDWQDDMLKTTAGVVGATSQNWTNFPGSEVMCTFSLRFYCFER